MQDEGALAVRHKLRGRPSNNRTSALKRYYILSLIRSDYPDFGPTLEAEKLAERHCIQVSSESLRQWMLAAGLWQSRAQRHRVHQPRLRREALGELIQIEGSEHRWFEDRGPVCTLLVVIDDATGRLMQMRCKPSETDWLRRMDASKSQGPHFQPEQVGTMWGLHDIESEIAHRGCRVLDRTRQPLQSRTETSGK